MATTKNKTKARRGQPGFNMAARQITCEDYMPEPGDWEETNVLFDFGDGWLICEDRTTYDRKLMAKLTLTCVGGNQFIDKCFPGMSEEEYWESRYNYHRSATPEAYWKNQYSRKVIESRLADAKKWKDTWSIDAYQRQLDECVDTYEEFIENRVKGDRKRANGKVDGYGPPTPIYRLGHVRDPEGRPRAAILFVRREAIRGCEGYDAKIGARTAYSTSNDLGQEGFINIDGQDFRMVEIRLGTGKTAPRDALERCAIFYQEIVGEWDQEAFETAKAPQYTKYTTNEDITKYRRKEQA